jgi:hypothetical protein
VITISSPALRFAVEHGDELFPLAPVVYAGVLPKELEQISLARELHGSARGSRFRRAVGAHSPGAAPDQAGCLRQWGLHDRSRLAGLFREAAEPFTDRLEFTYLNHLPLEEIEAQVRGLPPDTVVLLSTFTVDAKGRGHVTADVAALLADASSVPVYICFDSFMVPGVLGGWLFSFEMIGRKAAETGSQILQGGGVPPVVSMGYGVHLHKFDWRQLQRWRISEDRLPAGSHVLFKTPSFWELYRLHALGALTFFLLQSGLISFLLIQRRHRRQAEGTLADQLEFEKRLSALSAGFLLSTPSDLDEQIAKTVKAFGEISRVDRVGVFEISMDGQQIITMHFHAAQDLPPVPQQIDLQSDDLVQGRTHGRQDCRFLRP